MILFTLLSIINTPTVRNLVKDSYFQFTGREDYIRVIHFYNNNCPACDSVENVYEEVSRMYYQEKRIEFGQLDCDKATDVCDSSSARDFPVWFVWFQGQTHPKRFNRNHDVEQFVKFIRQGSGIRPTANENNLLYMSNNEAGNLTKKAMCNFVIVDRPMEEASQHLHNESRHAELSVKRGAKFFAVDKDDVPVAAKKLAGKEYGAFFVKNNKWTEYKGEEDEKSIVQFLKEQKCNLIISTPTPTPEPLPELEDVADDDGFFQNDEEVEAELKKQKADDDEDEDEDSEKENGNDDFEEANDVDFNNDNDSEFTE